MQKKKLLWFQAKNYGWGWYPSSWQGWTILFLYVAILLWLLYSTDMTSHSVNSSFIIQTCGLTILLIIICYATGEKPEWRWGRKKHV